MSCWWIVLTSCWWTVLTSWAILVERQLCSMSFLDVLHDDPASVSVAR